MNVNANNFAISQFANNTINSSKAGNTNEGIFAKLLNNASESQLIFGGTNVNLLDISLEVFIEDSYVEIEEKNEEKEKHISYENMNLGNIFFFRPDDQFKNGFAAENLSSSADNIISDNQLLLKGLGQANSLKGTLEALLGQNTVENFTNEIEINEGLRNVVGKEEARPASVLDQRSHVYMEKAKIEYEHVGLSTLTGPLVENKTIIITDESTEIRSQVISQVKDKIIVMTDNIQDTNGVKTITMELRPQSLGKVDIKMVYENNKLTVEIKAQSEETQKILSSNTADLLDLLNKSSDLDVKVIVKPHIEPKYQPLHNYQNNQANEQNFYQSNDANHQNHQGRQHNKYYYNSLKQSEEDVFSELIDLNYSKVKEGRYGN